MAIVFVGIDLAKNVFAVHGVDEQGKPALVRPAVPRTKLHELIASYDTKSFVKACREIDVTPHFAQNINRNGGSAIDGRTTRHPGYAVSQRKRKHIEQCFGWGKLIGPIRQVMVHGLDKVDQLLTLTMAAYNLTRLRTLAQLRPQCAQ